MKDEKVNYSSSDFLEKAEKGGLNYINKEQSYLKISVIFPIYSLGIIIINIVIILIGAIFLRISQSGTPRPDPDLTLDQKLILGFILIIPSLVFFALSLFSLVQFLFLKKWKMKVHAYHKEFGELKSKEISNQETETGSTATLTNLFYDIVKHMEKIRKVFIIINILAFFYIWWSLRLFGAIIYLLVQEVASFFPFMLILNFSGAIVLIIFLIFMWIHFLPWNRKLKSLKNFEQKIAEELDLDF